MAFDVEITFTGICGFVDRDVSAGGDKAVCVMLPNAWRNDPNVRKLSSVDGQTPLKPHRAFLSFNLADVENPPASVGVKTDCIHLLDGQYISLHPMGGANPLTVSGMAGVASFAETVRDVSFGTVQGVLSAPTQTKLAALVLLEEGTLEGAAKSPTWSITQLGGSVVNKQLNPDVVLTLGGLTKFELRVRPFGEPNPANAKKIQLAPAGTATKVQITIANLCDQDPLRWSKPRAVAPNTRDDDFAWHYELVDKKTALAAAIQPNRVPVPVYTALPAGDGFNCFGKRFSPTVFNPAAMKS